MVEKPPLDRYHTYREVEAPGGPGGEWRHFYQPYIGKPYDYLNLVTIQFFFVSNTSRI